MTKFKLTAVHEYDGKVDSTVTHEFDYDTLDDVVGAMQDFLRGVGYYFKGDLTIADPTEYVIATDNDDCVPTTSKTESPHNHYYYDTDRNR